MENDLNKLFAEVDHEQLPKRFVREVVSHEILAEPLMAELKRLAEKAANDEANVASGEWLKVEGWDEERYGLVRRDGNDWVVIDNWYKYPDGAEVEVTGVHQHWYAKQEYDRLWEEVELFALLSPLLSNTVTA